MAYLTEQELLDSCYYWYCDLALTSQVFLIVFVVIQAALLVALILFLRKFERLSKAQKRVTEESYTTWEDQGRTKKKEDSGI